MSILEELTHIIAAPTSAEEKVAIIRGKLEAIKPLWEFSEFEIADAVCRFYKVPMEDLYSRKRYGTHTKGHDGNIVMARHMTWYFLIQFKELNYSDVARRWNADHTTIRSGYLKVCGYIEVEEGTAQHIEEIKKLLY